MRVMRLPATHHSAGYLDSTDIQNGTDMKSGTRHRSVEPTQKWVPPLDRGITLELRSGAKAVERFSPFRGSFRLRQPLGLALSTSGPAAARTAHLRGKEPRVNPEELASGTAVMAVPLDYWERGSLVRR